MNLIVQRLDARARIPSYAHPGDAGLDLYAIENVTIKSKEIQLVRTGISIELPDNTEAQIRPRSGLAYKEGITVLNSPGTIDKGYTGEIKVIIVNHSTSDFKVYEGLKIAQMVICPIIKVSITEGELQSTERGTNGFGSTGY